MTEDVVTVVGAQVMTGKDGSRFAHVTCVGESISVTMRTEVEHAPALGSRFIVSIRRLPDLGPRAMEVSADPRADPE
jgi:hypothetical protein